MITRGKFSKFNPVTGRVKECLSAQVTVYMCGDAGRGDLHDNVRVACTLSGTTPNLLVFYHITTIITTGLDVYANELTSICWVA